MKRKEFLLLLLSVIQIGVFAQKTEDENNLYWQSDRKINFSDYQSKSDTNCIKYNEKYGLKMSSSMGCRCTQKMEREDGQSLCSSCLL